MCGIFWPTYGTAPPSVSVWSGDGERCVGAFFFPLAVEELSYTLLFGRCGVYLNDRHAALRLSSLCRDYFARLPFMLSGCSCGPFPFWPLVAFV